MHDVAWPTTNKLFVRALIGNFAASRGCCSPFFERYAIPYRSVGVDANLLCVPLNLFVHRRSVGRLRCALSTSR